MSELADDASVTAPVEAEPPITDDELSVRAEGAGSGVTVSGDEALAPFQLAVIVAVVEAATALVDSGNEIDGLPAGIITWNGGFAACELLARLTTAPPEGATPFSMMMA